MEMLPGNRVLMIRVEQEGVVGNRGVGRLQHSLLGSVMLYEGAAADVVGGCICFLLVEGCRSCGIIVGTPGGQIRKVCGESRGWGRGRVVHGWDKGITVGGGCGCWYGTRVGCEPCVGGLGVVVGVAVATRRLCWEGRGAGEQLLATTVSSSMSLSLSVRILKGLLCRVRRWCTIGNQWIVHGIVMVFDVVSTLGGVAITTLGGGSVSTLKDV
jgi:hypothetical protein